MGFSATMPGQLLVAENTNDRTFGPLRPRLHALPVHHHAVAGVLGSAVDPGNAGHDLFYSLVIGGVLVAGGPVDRRQGGLGEPESGNQLWRRRQGMAVATVRRPGLKPPPGLDVSAPGVGRRGAVQRLLDPALVLDRETGVRQISGVLAEGLKCHVFTWWKAI